MFKKLERSHTHTYTHAHTYTYIYRLHLYFRIISDVHVLLSVLIHFSSQNDWVPRRQESLKTIDQIHREAQQEHEQEQELIKHITIHTHPSMAKPNRGGGGDSGDKKRGMCTVKCRNYVNMLGPALFIPLTTNVHNTSNASFIPLARLY